jgi:hypothetical protein
MERRAAIKRTAIMAGSASLTPSLLALLNSCQKQSRLDWQPVFLNNDQARLISTILDIVLPKTSTPGALEMKVDLFVDSIFAKLYNEEAQTKVIEEMAKFNTASKEKFGHTFADLEHKDQVEMLKIEESKSGKFNGTVWGTAVGKQDPVGFYRSLKSLALWSYFTSEEIGKNVLNYDPVPGEYLGCVPLSDIGNTWSL